MNYSQPLYALRLDGNQVRTLCYRFPAIHHTELPWDTAKHAWETLLDRLEGQKFEEDAIWRILWEKWKIPDGRKEIKSATHDQPERAQSTAPMASVDIFLSYNSVERAQVEELRRELSSRGMSVWMDHHEIRLAANWVNTIGCALEKAKLIGACIGRAGKGPWQEKEITPYIAKVVPIVLAEGVAIPWELQSNHGINYFPSVSEAVNQLVDEIKRRSH